MKLKNLRLLVQSQSTRERSRPKRSRDRRLSIESLENRQLLTAEGSVFELTQPIDLSGLSGAPSATIEWADGNRSTGTVSGVPSSGPLRAVIDYRYDTSNFFSSANRRETLESAINSVLSRFSDNLSGIRPTGNNRWTASVFRPDNGQLISLNNLTINENELRIFVGARSLPGNQLAEAGPGGTGASGTAEWVDTVLGRGERGARDERPTDFGPWGGQITFDSDVDWHFGETTEGLESNEHDFFSVVTHEFLHVLGFGISLRSIDRLSAFDVRVTNNQFTGPNARAAHPGPGNVPLDSSGGHFRNDVISEGQPAVLQAAIPRGTRRLATRLDLAAIDDIGWELIDPTATVTARHTFGDDGTYPAVVTVRGADGGEKTYPTSIRITNVAPTLNPRDDLQIVLGDEVNLSRLGQFSDPGFRQTQASPPTDETFTFNIDWGDGVTDSGVGNVIRAGRPGTTTVGEFSGQHVYSEPGTYTVAYSISDDDGGTDSQSFEVTVLPPPEINLSINRNSFAEDAGDDAATLTVSLVGFDTSRAHQISLTTSDPTEATVPPAVTIPAGVSSVNVPIAAVDDRLLDGLQTVEIIASGNVADSASATIDVTDAESVDLSLNRTSAGENQTTAQIQLTVTRSNTDRSAPLTVELTNSDESEIRIPNSVTIPANAESASVDVAILDDDLFDGEQIVEIAADAAGYSSDRIDFTVTDHEEIAIELDSNEISESNPDQPIIATISIPGAAPGAGLTFQLSTSQPNQIRIPETAVIRGGTRSIDVEIFANNDFRVEDDLVVSLEVTRQGFIGDQTEFTIRDDDTPIFQNPANLLDVDNNGRITPRDALLIINSLNRRGSRELDPANEEADLFIDPSGNGSIEPQDALLIINAINRSIL